MYMRKIAQKMTAAIVSAALLAGIFQTGGVKTAKAESENKEAVSITVDGNDIKSDNVNGLTFKGFGVLSANSSSDLLMDYKSESPEAYNQLLEYLFGGTYPIMNQVKIEMGNDQNNSTGAEAATMRSSDEDANVLRNPGWQLAADAKKINPNLKVSILRWNKPGWVKTDEDIYKWYKNTILAAYEQYGYMVDYINPNTNESWHDTWDVPFTKKFAEWIADEDSTTIPDDTQRSLYQKIKLVVSDEAATVSDSVGDSLKSDSDFYNFVDVVGYHYSTDDDSNDSMKWLADVCDKEVWNSEAQATFSNSAFRPSNNDKSPTLAGTGIGGTGSALEMGNTFIKGFVKSRRTHVIYQPAIGSFYEGGQYSFKELVSARDPWSGWMHYDAGLLVLAHVSKFAVTGWENDTNTAGIWRGIPEASQTSAEGTNPVNGRNGGPNYMTLASPAKDNFSTVIVNDSENAMTYNIKTANMNLLEDQKLAVWETRAADDGAFNENYMQHTADVSKSLTGEYTIEVAPYSMVTVTSLALTSSEEEEIKLPVEGERTVLDNGGKYLYTDDFDYSKEYIESRGGDTGAIARYTNMLNGAFEAYKTTSGNYVLRQQLDKSTYGIGGSWSKGDAAVIIGDLRWMNYAVSVDALFENKEETPYAGVSIRQTGTSQELTKSSGYTFRLYQSGQWILYRKSVEVKKGKLTAKKGFKSGVNVWNNIKLEGAGSTINAYVNGVNVATYKDKVPVTSGRIGLGSAYSFTQFDNLKVSKISGYTPYYTELLDNMETYDLTSEKNAKLVYNDKWSHQCGQGMYIYQRTISTSTEAGATMSYTFNGTGMEILSGISSVAVLKVTVDGKVVTKSALTNVADNLNSAYTLSGLKYGKHTVTIEILRGKLSIDSVGILGAVYTGDVTAGSAKYTISNLNRKTVIYKSPVRKSATKQTIPAAVSIKINDKKTTFKVVGIAKGAFKNCKKLKTLNIKGKLDKVAKGAFDGCSGKIKVTGKNVKTNIKKLKKSGYTKFTK